ncbi:MAG: hypothetical protein HN578_04560 [Rhodospirillales bacterium]|jgi:hypothetical protein|nr:hypothetical protein [Rhodospirillales bacterium]
MKSFLSAILPDQGVYFIATKSFGGFAHHPCHTIGEMVLKSREIDGQGADAFFACASYLRESYIDGDGLTHYRTGENAGWVKSFWLDIDCGADKAAKATGYATLKEALAALQSFIIAVGLPKPIFVLSGGGLHIYWPLTVTITKEQWLPAARQLKELTKCPAIRLIADDARTSDIASILRPIDTHNYKPERNGALVTQRIDGEPTAFDELSQIISKAHQKHCGGSVRPNGGIQLGTTQSAPDPETPKNVARVKSALAAINPDCDRDLWRDICCAVHALNWTCSRELADSWSKGDLI